MAVVQAFNRERRFQAEFDALNEANRAQSTYVQKIFSSFFPSIEFLGVLAMGAVLYFGSRLYEHHTLTIGTLITAIYLLQLVFQPLQELSDVYGQLQSAGAAMVKIASILDEESEIGDRPGAKPLPRLEGDLDLDSLVFAYGKDPVLHGVSFHIAPGGCFALVGESGHGKSTLARLIGRHYDPDQGAVRVDGHDLRDVQLRSYRRQLGVVLQDPFLFAGTIADNIRYGRLDATDDEVFAAARAANAHDFVEGLPEGYETVVGERGARLSGGERQRICVARAFVRDAPILILDEPTSSIDSKTENVILDALDDLMVGRTSFMVAHRLSTVRDADRILVLDGGQIAAQGRHEELLEKSDLYRRMCARLSVGKSLDDPETVDELIEAAKR
jgi:ABC-type multidrug transport system fused ATPase/permease subunit